MTEEIAGFQTSPKAQVQVAFEEIARRSMHDLSFLHPSMPVYVSDFTLFEGQWTGCVITPWMLSAVIFPGPDQLWPLRKVSEKIGLQLPYGTMTFTVGELDGVSQYLSCSLMSPLSHSMSIEEGQRLTDDCARMILSLPVTNPDVPHAGRRPAIWPQEWRKCMSCRFARAPLKLSNGRRSSTMLSASPPCGWKLVHSPALRRAPSVLVLKLSATER